MGRGSDNEACQCPESFDSGQVEIRHAPEVVEMDEKPIAGIKGKESSMALLYKVLKKRKLRHFLVVVTLAA